MRAEEKWVVRIHDDNVNSFAGVALVLEELLGSSPGEGRAAAERIHTTGSAELDPLPVGPAEDFVAALQVRGLHATLRPAA
ncbi:ATP-dependent Clp protease adaptor ClpS [Amycolatopsis sp. NPDC051045]|uniref:ATP-dependent Clp protease adaptor ClpS n=1 Tax=Amycolatopsis sp. NPDC051045 TaxID=3156922 RepID=UPI00344A8230